MIYRFPENLGVKGSKRSSRLWGLPTPGHGPGDEIGDLLTLWSFGAAILFFLFTSSVCMFGGAATLDTRYAPFALHNHGIYYSVPAWLWWCCHILQVAAIGMMVSALIGIPIASQTRLRKVQLDRSWIACTATAAIGVFLANIIGIVLVVNIDFIGAAINQLREFIGIKAMN